MSCTHCRAAETQFNGRVAADDLNRYRRHGPDPSTRLLLDELRARGVRGASLLDVGGGIGVIGVELLSAGLGRVTLVEAASAYLATAKDLFERAPVGERVRFIHGDFAASTLRTDPADLVTLDRVVCCYPDFEALLTRAAGQARALLGLSYPRDGWHIRLVMGLQNLYRRITGNAFRTFVHANARIAEVIQGAGLSRVTRRGTFVWVVEVYERRAT